MSLSLENYFFKDECWWFSYKKTATFNEEGKLQSYNDEPALIFYKSNGTTVMRKEWYTNGLPDREKEASVEIYITTVTEKLIRKQYYRMGKLHRENEPAEILYNTCNGKLYLQKYYINGLLHREDQPSIIYEVTEENYLEYKYTIDGKYHNFNGPAIYIIDNKIVEKEIYYLFGKQFDDKKQYIKQKRIYKIIQNSVKNRRRKILSRSLKSTQLNKTNGPDICDLVSSFVY